MQLEEEQPLLNAIKKLPLRRRFATTVATSNGMFS
jgi:hypothetical protein